MPGRISVSRSAAYAAAFSCVVHPCQIRLIIAPASYPSAPFSVRARARRTGGGRRDEDDLCAAVACASRFGVGGDGIACAHAARLDARDVYPCRDELLGEDACAILRQLL